jgi:hypothetical protein
MWRFLLPALAMMAALIVLFAGAWGDLKSLPSLADQAIATIDGIEPRPTPPSITLASPARSAEQKAARAALLRQIADLQRQAGDLRNQMAQRSYDLGVTRAETVGLRQGLEAMRLVTGALRRQRQAEETALARDRRPPAPRPASPPLPLVPAPTHPAAQQLLYAQQWLAAGRPAEARQILATTQTQMMLRPGTAYPMVEDGNPSATDIGAAIRWLDIGARGQAMQAISRAINHANHLRSRGSAIPTSLPTGETKTTGTTTRKTTGGTDDTNSNTGCSAHSPCRAVAASRWRIANTAAPPTTTNASRRPGPGGEVRDHATQLMTVTTEAPEERREHQVVNYRGFDSLLPRLQTQTKSPVKQSPEQKILRRDPDDPEGCRDDPQLRMGPARLSSTVKRRLISPPETRRHGTEFRIPDDALQEPRSA